MSWRGSTGHLDANVPDYQKMLQTRYPATGWSSTQSGYPSLSSRSHSVSYLNTAHRPPHYGDASHRPFSPTYKPPKYGLASTADSTYNTTNASSATYNTTNVSSGNSEFHKLDDSTFRGENGLDQMYGITSQEFDLRPYRSNTTRVTDYSSDSGRGHGSRHTTDYSSDSGANIRQQRRKSSPFELDIPSPPRSNNSQRQQTEDMFTSPVKSHVPVSDYLKVSEINARHDQEMLSRVHLPEYHRTEEEHEHSNDDHMYDNHDHHSESHVEHHDGDSDKHKRSIKSFVSPTLSSRDISETTLIHRGDEGVSVKQVGDLTQWQQKQRSFLATDHHPREAQGHHRSDVMGRHPGDTPKRRSGEQLEQIRSAADAIIRDKDAIIDELRSQVVAMEETVKGYENKLRRSLMAQSGDTSDRLSYSKMQELEYRNAELRTEMANLKLQKAAEVEDLELKLGAIRIWNQLPQQIVSATSIDSYKQRLSDAREAVEHEVVQLKGALRKSQPHMADIKEKIAMKEEEVASWKKKHGHMEESYEGLKQKLDGMERYLSDLPTTDEYKNVTDKLSACIEDNKVKHEQISDLEERLADTTQLLSEREHTVQELEGKQQQLSGRMMELTAEIRHIKSDGEGRALQQAQEELAEVAEVKDRATLDLGKAKKLLEVNHRRLRQLDVKHQAEVRQLEERLGHEEEEVTALREESRLIDEHVAKLNKSLKDHAGKNVELVNENHVLKEQLQQLAQLTADDHQKLQRRFVAEMKVCFTELQSIVQICVQRAEGQDPNMSLLLGMSASTLETEEVGASGGSRREEQTLKQWLGKLKELRAEVENIRKLICNKYAEDMGDNINCTTQ